MLFYMLAVHEVKSFIYDTEIILKINFKKDPYVSIFDSQTPDRLQHT